MTNKECTRVQALIQAYNRLLCACVDSIGLPKKPTGKQLKNALDALN